MIFRDVDGDLCNEILECPFFSGGFTVLLCVATLTVQRELAIYIIHRDKTHAGPLIINNLIFIIEPVQWPLYNNYNIIVSMVNELLTYCEDIEDSVMTVSDH